MPTAEPIVFHCVLQVGEWGFSAQEDGVLKKKTFWKYKHISISVKCKNFIHYNHWPYESANQPLHSGRRGITDHGWNRLFSGLVVLAYYFAHILCLCFLCVKIYNHIIWYLYLVYSAKENMKKKLPSKEQERERERIRVIHWSTFNSKCHARRAQKA